MPDDPLVERLVAELRPVRRRRIGREAAILAGLGVAQLAAFFAVGLIRPDLSVAMLLMSFWWKLASMLLIAVIGGAAALASFTPGVSPRAGLRRAGAVIAVSVAVGWVIDVARAGTASMVARLDWSLGVQCVLEMFLLSLPAVVAFGLLMRGGASTDRRGSAAAVGLAAGGWGAFVFVFACPKDDPFYLVVWYSVGVGLTMLVARLLLPRLSRW